jgi:hypothetical protein
MNQTKVPMTDIPCPRCTALARELKIRAEMVMSLPAGAFAPQDYRGNKQCFDCNAAQLVQRVVLKIPGITGFEMARIAVGNDRQESLRLPSVPMGLIMAGLMQASKVGDFERHLKWIERNDWFGQRDVQV